MLADQKMYNTSEMLRKKQESTRRFFKDVQLKKIKETKQKMLDEQKKWINQEFAKKNKIFQISQQNVALAQSHMDRLKVQKFQGIEDLYL